MSFAKKLFGDKLSTATARLASFVALVGSTGFKVNAAAISDLDTEAEMPTAEQLAAHLATAGSEAVKAATDPLKTQIAQLGAAAAQASAFNAGFEAAGVKLGEWLAADKGEGDRSNPLVRS